MILLKKCLLTSLDLCAGGIIAAGVYAFLVIIDVFVRPMGKTGTRKYTFPYETATILGRVLGDILDIHEPPIYMGLYLDTPPMCAHRPSVRIFVGCLVISLAETLKAPLVISRRIHLVVELQYLIFAMAVEKMAGSPIYFRNRTASLG